MIALEFGILVEKCCTVFVETVYVVRIMHVIAVFIKDHW